MAEMVTVLLSTGATLPLHPSEVDDVRASIRKYDDTFKFENHADLAALDQLIMMEAQIARWTNWVMSGHDYDQLPIDDARYSKMIKEHSAEARQLRSKLGIDKVSRDNQKAQDDVATYIENLKHRAGQFGIHRNKQFEMVLTLFAEVQAKVTLYKNTEQHPSEQQELGVTAPEILDWLHEDAIPRYEELDEHFRTAGPDAQNLWIREL